MHDVAKGIFTEFTSVSENFMLDTCPNCIDRVSSMKVTSFRINMSYNLKKNLQGLRRVLLTLLVFPFGTDASVSDECISEWNAMRNDANFQYVNTTSLELCYIKYQNAVALHPNETRTSSVVECEYHEYTEFCSKYVNGGTLCALNTGWLSFNLCLPSACTSSESDKTGLVAQFYNPTTSNITCMTPPPSAVVPAVLSTVAVLAITVLLVFSFRPPSDVVESKKLEKSKTIMRALRVEAAHSNIIELPEYNDNPS